VSETGQRDAVRLTRIHKRYGGRVVLAGVELTIARGEFFALLGPSGSGKSTLLRTVSGIETPDEGSVWLAGRDVTHVPAYRRPVHTVFQNYALFPHLSVSDNVAFPLRVAGLSRSERRRRALQALTWVRLEEFADARIQTLSGGERQRVALARALVDEPEVVLLDEPLSALDPHLRVATLEFLKDVQARLHATYLYVTHDREEALRAADRVAVLNNGRLEQVGRPEELYHSPATAFVASFVGPINWLPGSREGNKVRLAGSDALLAVNGQTPETTGRVRIGVRPEDLRLGDAGPLPGRVVQRQFAGASVVVRVSTECGELTAELRGDTVIPGVGALVRVGWEAEKTHLFGEDQP